MEDPFAGFEAPTAGLEGPPVACLAGPLAGLEDPPVAGLEGPLADLEAPTAGLEGPPARLLEPGVPVTFWLLLWTLWRSFAASEARSFKSDSWELAGGGPAGSRRWI